MVRYKRDIIREVIKELQEDRYMCIKGCISYPTKKMVGQNMFEICDKHSLIMMYKIKDDN